ncbi:MAG: glutathione S-transferase family protein [Pseudomonadota bacterium]
MTQDITIYGLPQSNWVWSTRLFARAKGLEVRHVASAPHSEDVRAISPLGKIPVLRHGAVELAESRAICGYLDVLGAGPSLMPQTPVEEMWLSLIQTGLEPMLIRDYVFGYIFPGTEDGAPDRARIDGLRDTLASKLGAVTQGLSAGILGARRSVLDIMMTPILFYVGQFPEGAAAIESDSRLADYRDALVQHPDIAATAPQAEAA